MVEVSEKFTRFTVLRLVEVLLSYFGDQAAGEASIIISSCFFRREEINLTEFFVSFCHMFSFVGLRERSHQAGLLRPLRPPGGGFDFR